METHYGESEWQGEEIFIRIVTYPFCLAFIFAGIYTGYITFGESCDISRKQYIIGFILSIHLTLIPFLYLCDDLKTLFYKNEKKGMNNILDEGVFNSETNPSDG